MKKVLALGGSNSSKSINRKFAEYAASRILDAEVIKFDLSKHELPLFGIDREAEEGAPEAAHDFVDIISNCDGIILSVAEHNGNIAAAFKNLWDWASRIEKKVWQGKPLFLLSSSPGKRGAASAHGIVQQVIPFYGGNIVASFSLPNFYDNISDGSLKNQELEAEFVNELNKFVAAIGL